VQNQYRIVDRAAGIAMGLAQGPDMYPELRQSFAVGEVEILD
jgi:hypothetical protein